MPISPKICQSVWATEQHVVRQVFYVSFDSIDLMAPTALAQKLRALIGLTAEALAD